MGQETALPGSGEGEIVSLLNRFFLHLDERRYEALAALFTPDGGWHRQGRLLRGRAEIMAALNERSPTMRICHVITNAFADVTNAGSAEAHCVMTAYRHDDGTHSEAPPTISGPSTLARVDARLRRMPEGWRIEQMTVRYLFHIAATA